MSKAIRLPPKYRDLTQTLERRPLICTPINANDKSDFLDNVPKAIDGGSDLAEFRIDFFDKITTEDIDYLSSKSNLPLIVTNRNKENGGRFSLGEESRLSLLRSAISSKPAFIDIELSTNEKERSDIINLAKDNNVGVICSYHDFNKTPSQTQIYERYVKIAQTEADLAKLVVTPQSDGDVRTILETSDLLRHQNTMYTLFGMGKKGQNSRLLSTLLGSSLTYCSLDNKTQNSLYQISLGDTKRFFNIIEKKGWNAIREKRHELIEMIMIELDGDSSLRSLDKLLV